MMETGRLERLYEVPSMPSVPRIRRAVVNEAEVYRPTAPVPVIASLHWGVSGMTQEVEGLVTAWTRSAVELRWEWQGQRRTDWVEARCVRRRSL
jgi:hypothetical protein